MTAGFKEKTGKTGQRKAARQLFEKLFT